MTVVEAYIGKKKIDPPEDGSHIHVDREGISQNTSGSVFPSKDGGGVEVSGSLTENGILDWRIKDVYSLSKKLFVLLDPKTKSVEDFIIQDETAGEWL